MVSTTRMIFVVLEKSCKWMFRHRKKGGDVPNLALPRSPARSFFNTLLNTLSLHQTSNIIKRIDGCRGRTRSALYLVNRSRSEVIQAWLHRSPGPVNQATSPRARMHLNTLLSQRQPDSLMDQTDRSIIVTWNVSILT